jgi:hypothetical protein
MNKAFLAAALMLPLVAQAAAVGTMFGGPYIYGAIRPGDYEKVQSDFAKGFSKPLDIKVDTDSHPFETMRIGLWLADKRPPLRVLRQCVGPCASFLLMAASSARIEKGALIAFNVRPEWEAWAFGRIREDGKELFIEQEMSQLSRARLLDRFKTRAKTSGLMRDAADQLMPAPAIQFLRALTLPVQLNQVAFDEERYDFKLSLKVGQCLWWVPDAQGLAQLGVQVSDSYSPVDRDRAAKQLGVSPALVYIGPMVDPIPEGGLCTQP